MSVHFLAAYLSPPAAEGMLTTRKGEGSVSELRKGEKLEQTMQLLPFLTASARTHGEPTERAGRWPHCLESSSGYRGEGERFHSKSFHPFTSGVAFDR
jgi:hypothetical protein